MNKKILENYKLVNNLKNVIRTGWLEVGISSERTESVPDHIVGTWFLAVELDSEYDLKLDMKKVLMMIFLKELEKVNLLKEQTPEGNIDASKKEESRNVVAKALNGLAKQDELLANYDEVVAKSSKEAIFVSKVTKIESDIQAKIYDLNGHFNMDNAIADVKNYGEDLSSKILPQMKNASDGWIMFDRRYYEGDKIFEDLSQSIQDME